MTVAHAMRREVIAGEAKDFLSQNVVVPVLQSSLARPEHAVTADGRVRTLESHPDGQ